MILREVLKHISSAGMSLRSYGDVDDELCRKLRKCGKYNQLSPSSWQSIVASLSDSELIDLIYGLTFAEKKCKWIGGSAASTIWVFRALVSRTPDRALLDEVSFWVVSHRANPYIPFGSSAFPTADTYTSYLKLSAEQAASRAQYEKEEANRQNNAKMQRQSRKESCQRASNHRRTPIRDRLKRSLEDKTLRERLEMLVNDNDYPPKFYPTCLAGASTINELEALSISNRRVLMGKLKGRHRGPWGEFKKRLMIVGEYGRR